MEEEKVDDKEILEIELGKLVNVLEEIPLEDKTVLLMKYKDGMGIKDISGIIGKSESAIKMKIKRAKAKAKKAYLRLYPKEEY